MPTHKKNARRVPTRVTGEVGVLRGKHQRLFAFSHSPDDKPEYAGEVVSETAETIRISCLDAVMLWFGVAIPLGEVKDVPRERVRLFDSRNAMLEAVKCSMRETVV